MFSTTLSATFSVDSPLMYIMYGVVLVFIIALALYYLIISITRAKKLGMDMTKIKKVITTSVSFSILPSIGIGMGVVALIGSIGVALPSIRLSVIGSLQYETQMAGGAIDALTGGTGDLLAMDMTAKQFVTIASVMTVAIMSGPVITLVFYRRLQPKIGNLMGKNTKSSNGGKSVNIGELIFQVSFIGMVIGYLAMSITTFTTGVGFIDNYYNFIALIVGMLVMYICDLLITKAKWKWLDSFATPISMLIGMAVVAVIAYCASKYNIPVKPDVATLLM